MSQTSTPSPQPSASTPIQVGPHELFIVGVVAISRTAAYTRYAKGADRVPRMTARVGLLCMSAQEVAPFSRVVESATTHGVDALETAGHFTDALGDFDRRLRPLDWVERLLKTYITFGLLVNFRMTLNESLKDPLRRGLVHELSQDPISTYAIARLEETIAADSQLAARLGLWDRRVIGEEIGTF